MTATRREQILHWLQGLGYDGEVPQKTSRALELLREEQRKHPPSEKQLRYLRSLGFKESEPETMAHAAVQIEALLDGADPERLDEYFERKRLAEARPFDDPEVPGMKRFIFSIDDLKKIRKRIHSALPKTHFDHESEGWSAFSGNWARLFKALKHLKIRGGYTLGAYLFQSGGNGNGCVFGVPTENASDEVEVVKRKPRPGRINLPPYAVGHLTVSPEDPWGAPKLPEGGVARYMSLFQGDGTPESFMEAAILAHELDEFGALWHGVYWGCVSFVGPLEVKKLSRCPRSRRRKHPGVRESEYRFLYKSANGVSRRANPSVTMLPDKTIFRFLGFSELGQCRIFLKRHVFSDPNSMELEMESDDIAIGHGGIIH